VTTHYEPNEVSADRIGVARDAFLSDLKNALKDGYDIIDVEWTYRLYKRNDYLTKKGSMCIG
jgi:hypothetical protein